MSATKVTSTEGRVKQVIGAVVDVEFPKGELPAVYTALNCSPTHPSTKTKTTWFWK
jgi:F-type H+-transporting ATPase subunit beta